MAKENNIDAINSICNAVDRAPEILTSEQCKEKFIEENKDVSLRELIVGGFPEIIVDRYMIQREATDPSLVRKYHTSLSDAIKSVPVEKRGGIRLV